MLNIQKSLNSKFSWLSRLLVCALIVLQCSMQNLSAKGDEFQLISDEETEELLLDWLARLFKVAGISTAPRVYLVKTNEINAAATYGATIFVFTGLIMKCQDSSQLFGILAHETGHIAGSHMAKASSAVQEAAAPAFATMLIGGAAALMTGNPGILMAGLMGGSHVFERSMLRHSRDQEDAADASALTYLRALKMPVNGLAQFHELLGHHYMTGQEDPYTLTHPLPLDRKQKIELFQTDVTKDYAMPVQDVERFSRVRAKLFGYLKSKMEVARAYPLSDTSLSARYARLINNYIHSKQAGKAHKAIDELNQLLTLKPNDPYFLEMQGQFLFEAGRPREAINYFKRALQARPNAYIIKLMLGQALIEADQDNKSLQEAIIELTQVTEHQPQQLMAWRLLGTAYGKNNQSNDAAACLAEEALQTNNFNLAKMQAKRGKNATNTALRKRAEDILKHIENLEGTG